MLLVFKSKETEKRLDWDLFRKITNLKKSDRNFVCREYISFKKAIYENPGTYLQCDGLLLDDVVQDSFFLGS